MSQDEHDFAMHIVDEAFTAKRQDTAEERQAIIKKFSNNVYSICRDTVHRYTAKQYQNSRKNKQVKSDKVTKKDCEKYIKRVSEIFYKTSGGYQILDNAYNGLLYGCYEKVGTMTLTTLKKREDFICNGLRDGTIAHGMIDKLGK